MSTPESLLRGATKDEVGSITFSVRTSFTEEPIQVTVRRAMAYTEDESGRRSPGVETVCQTVANAIAKRYAPNFNAGSDKALLSRNNEHIPANTVLIDYLNDGDEVTLSVMGSNV